MSQSSHQSTDLTHFIVDKEDDECPNFALHVAAYQDEVEELEVLLQDPENLAQINSRIRPFLATPLRLAATAGSLSCVSLLLDHGADVDCLDVKAQTPLFVALVNQHWECSKYLLDAGADPNGNEKNLCTPLSIMCQRGFYPGVKLLCEYGADTEDVLRLMTGMPGLPITTCATYHHLKCFVTLLLYGASPDLTPYAQLDLPSYMIAQCSVPHNVIRYKSPAEFIYLYREFGGNLWIKDSRGRLASEILDSAPAIELLKSFQEYPLSLQSQCRLVIRRTLGKSRIHLIDTIGLQHRLTDFLKYQHFDPSSFDPNNPEQIAMYQKLVQVCCEVSDNIPNSYHPLAVVNQADINNKINMILLNCVLSSTKHETTNPQPSTVAGPPPPPPPVAPTPPRPGFFRFKSAEGLKKQHFSGKK